jgi:hypothetical protein
MGWDPDEQYACGITARANCRLIFWECGLTYKLKYRIKCQPAQTGVWYSRTAKCWFSAATGTANFVITAWNMKEQRRISQLHGHQGVVTDIVDIPTHNFFATGSLDKVIYLWDAKTLLQVSKILDSPKGIRCLAYMPENDFLFSAGFATFASVYSPKIAGRKSTVGHLDAHISPLVAVRVVPGSTIVITGDEMGFIRIWDLRRWECIQVLEPHQIPVAFTNFFVIMRPGTPHPDILLTGEQYHFIVPDTQMLEDETPQEANTGAGQESNVVPNIIRLADGDL